MLKRGNQVLMWVLVLLFLAALARIVSLRLGSGEVYPEYSSLRADPRGAKAFFESLGRLENTQVTRHLQSPQRLPGDAQTTVLFLGANRLDPQFHQHIERIARAGARVVIAVNASKSIREEREEDRVNRPGNDQAEPDEEKEPRDLSTFATRFPSIQLIDPLRLESEPLLAYRISDDRDLPDALSWYGRYCFDKLTDEWESLYEAKGKPVVVQCDLGLEKLVLCADSFAFSNEGLARERSLDFLLWIIGDSGKVVFDEAHLGVQQGSSIMVMLRQFRLQGLFFGFLLVAALWIWKNTASFVPLHPEGADGEIIKGKTAREGVVHLLERNLPPDQLPEICLAEWRKSHPHLNNFDTARFAEAERVLGDYRQRAKKERNPVQTYQEITSILSK